MLTYRNAGAEMRFTPINQTGTRLVFTFLLSPLATPERRPALVDRRPADRGTQRRGRHQPPGLSGYWTGVAPEGWHVLGRAGAHRTRPSPACCAGCLRLLRPDEGAPVGVQRSGVVTDELGGRVDGAVRAGHRGAVVAPPAGRAKAKGLVAGEAVL